uniref:ABC transporter domain-containing protein n=1 Tax=Ananas comosus var. bracteatus TaxID=296719 RepID=A0A6V7NHF4_ANACO|nr:unnamed protein product [Ananas comosus var. bracteatus]
MGDATTSSVTAARSRPSTFDEPFPLSLAGSSLVAEPPHGFSSSSSFCFFWPSLPFRHPCHGRHLLACALASPFPGQLLPVPCCISILSWIASPIALAEGGDGGRRHHHQIEEQQPAELDDGELQGAVGRVPARCAGGDDEENLKWAALEKLPTYDRMRKGILRRIMEEDGGKVSSSEVELHKLGVQERKILLDHIFKVVEQDNERFLLRLRDRIDRVGLELPRIEVRYENLSIEADVYVGSRALPTLWNTYVNVVEGFIGRFSPSKKKTIKILDDVSGILKPSRTTLLLGPPAAGKTTLMLALAGKADKNLRVSGRVTYCGHELTEFYPERTSAYISQHDLHNGEMTVRETIDFSARCLGVGTRYEMLSELSRREKGAGIKPDPRSMLS